MRRFFLGLVGTVAALAAVIAVAVAVLVATNPDPRPVDGWSELAPLPEPRGEVASAVVGGPGGERLAVVGGFVRPIRTSDAVTFYDPVEDHWAAGPPLPEPRHHAGAAGLDGALYVSGGAPSTGDWDPRHEVWVLERDASDWAPVEPMPEGRLGHRMVAHEGRLYVVGGEGGADVLVYDPDTGWSVGAAIPQPRDHLGVVVRDGEVWAIGGRHQDQMFDRVDVYDPAADTWRSGPPLPAPTSASAAGVLDGTILVLAGEDRATFAGQVFDVAWRLPPGADDWQPAAPLPLPVHGAGDGVVGGRLVVAGGASRQGALSIFSWTDRVDSLADADAPGR
jgi:N-acetylneuraminic acid mutarotase